MKFYTHIYRTNPPVPDIYPAAVLTTDNWNDFGFKTSFHVKLYLAGDDVLNLGEVKILDKDNPHTILPSQFEQLPPNFCSLGQTLDYYKNLEQIGSTKFGPYLTAINDVVFGEPVSESFISEDGFRVSLLRSGEAETAFREAGAYFFEGYPPASVFDFAFRTMLPGANLPHAAEFELRPAETPPARLAAIVGKNGTGKTRYLSSLADALSGIEGLPTDFFPARPSFSKIIVVSYSVFDHYRQPTDGANVYNYIYSGIRDNELLDLAKLWARVKQSMVSIGKQRRLSIWKNVVSEMVGIDNVDSLHNLIKSSTSTVDSISSGQNIILAVVTDVIAHIRPRSLLIIDEPEMHLHPDAESNFIRMLYKLLDSFDSYAILATHSPVIIQEVPSKAVSIFERGESGPLVRKPSIECFGENLTAISDEVFGVEGTKSNYRSYLKNLAERHTYEEILEIFDGRLSFSAQIFLRSLFVVS